MRPTHDNDVKSLYFVPNERQRYNKAEQWRLAERLVNLDESLLTDSAEKTKSFQRKELDFLKPPPSQAPPVDLSHLTAIINPTNVAQTVMIAPVQTSEVVVGSTAITHPIQTIAPAREPKLLGRLPRKTSTSNPTPSVSYVPLTAAEHAQLQPPKQKHRAIFPKRSTLPTFAPVTIQPLVSLLRSPADDPTPAPARPAAECAVIDVRPMPSVQPSLADVSTHASSQLLARPRPRNDNSEKNPIEIIDSSDDEKDGDVMQHLPLSVALVDEDEEFSADFRHDVLEAEDDDEDEDEEDNDNEVNDDFMEVDIVP